MEGDEFSAGEEEGDFDEGGGGQEEMVEFVTNGVCVSVYVRYMRCVWYRGGPGGFTRGEDFNSIHDQV